jgi:RNA polymerase sigma-B factor
MKGPMSEPKRAAAAPATARLLREYHNTGDTTARRQLIELHMPLVEALARRHAGRDDYEDLVQVGCIGLIQAIDRFKPERGDELAAFAVPNIAGEISRYLRDRGSSVRLPRSVYELRVPLVRAQAELASRLGRAPTAAELAGALEVPEEQVALALEADAASTPTALAPEAQSATADSVLDDTEQRLFLAEVFRDLEERERRILYLRYVRDLTAADVGRELGLSERAVVRATRSALGKLRAGLEQPGGEEPAGKPPAAAGKPPAAHRLPRQSGGPKIASMASGQPQARDRYLDEPYHIALMKSDSSDGGWKAHVEELPGCEAHGATPDEAARRIEGAMEDWIADALANRRPVPPPRSASSHSGRLMLRMPQSLHAELSRVAEREDVSLNQLITSTLASSVGWRRDGAPAGAANAESAAEASGSLRKTLLANVVVLAVVGLVAVVLLLIALIQNL